MFHLTAEDPDTAKSKKSVHVRKQVCRAWKMDEHQYSSLQTASLNSQKVLKGRGFKGRHLIGESMSKPQTSRTALRRYVCI